MRVLWGLIGVNVAVFVLWHLLVGNPLHAMLQGNLLVAQGTVLSRPWTLLTYAFTHYDTSHLLFNMFGLYIFGRPVLERYGTRDLLVLYAGGALLGAIAHVVGTPVPALGASASVMAVTVAYAATFPNRQLLLWFFLPVPAWLAAAGFIALDVMGAVGPGDGIAHAAHLGGAVFGMGWWMWRTQRTPRR